jgi:hypothetical protein
MVKIFEFRSNFEILPGNNLYLLGASRGSFRHINIREIRLESKRDNFNTNGQVVA